MQRKEHLFISSGRRRDRRIPASKDQRIEAKSSAPVEEYEEKDKAVQHGRLSLIDNRKEAALGMNHKVRNGHFAARDESSHTSHQAERDEKAQDQFKPGPDIKDSFAGAMAARWKAEEFLAAVAGEKQANHKSHKAINRIRETLERVHDARLFRAPGDVKIVTKEWRPRGRPRG